MDSEKVRQLQIDPAAKARPRRAFWTIILLVLLVSGLAAYFGIFRNDKRRLSGVTNQVLRALPPHPETTNSDSLDPGLLLTVSGHIVNRERIALSPRFLGVVKWIGVKKGDPVTNGQVVVLLDDSEYRARLGEAEGRKESAQIGVEKATLDYQRAQRLVRGNVEMQKMEDDARLQLSAARAVLKEIDGQLNLIKTYLDWTIIRSPINGVVLEKLVNPNELVVPQSFGGGRGPSTALIAVADPTDLQVEIDVGEADLAKIHLQQSCRVSPEAFPTRHYQAFVAEMAPEANRQKGTLQIKVQIIRPDKYLTPEMTARVDFFNAEKKTPD